MSRILSDGTVIESGLTSTGRGSASVAHSSAYHLQTGVVVKTIPIDDPNNLSKQFTEYHVLVNEFNTTIFYRNVRAQDIFGGNNNFSDISYTPIEKDEKSLANPEKLKGSQVLLLCMYGNKDTPVILGGLQHSSYRNDSDKSNAPEMSGSSASIDEDLKSLPTKLPGATSEDGDRILSEFNGVRWNINASGELTIMFQGPKDVDGNLTSDTGPTVMKFNKDGECFLLDNEDQEIKISRKDKKITLESGNGQKIEIDKENKILLDSGTGPVVELDRKAKIVNIGDGANSFAVSEEKLRLFMELHVFAPYNIHSHVGNLGIVTGTPTPQAPLPPHAPGKINAFPGIDGTPGSEFASKDVKVTKKG